MMSRVGSLAVCALSGAAVAAVLVAIGVSDWLFYVLVGLPLVVALARGRSQRRSRAAVRAPSDKGS